MPRIKTFKAPAAVLSALAAIMIALFLSAPAAFATSYNVYNYNSDPNSNIEEQTIVGEGSNNNVVVTNTASNPPSPTGIATAYAPVIVIAVVVVAGAAFVYINSRRKASLK